MGSEADLAIVQTAIVGSTIGRGSIGRSRTGSWAGVGAVAFAALVLCAAIGTTAATDAAAQGVRVVDAVNVTFAREETAHALHGDGMAVGETDGRRWRSASGWFSYTLRIYEDTPLTVACLFAAAADTGEAFDILVDDRKVASRVREPGSATSREFKVTLPLAETAGKSQVTVTFRAHPGARTARLFEVRTVQEHLE
jgi:hypothetical protein